VRRAARGHRAGRTRRPGVEALLELILIGSIRSIVGRSKKRARGSRWRQVPRRSAVKQRASRAAPGSLPPRLYSGRLPAVSSRRLPTRRKRRRFASVPRPRGSRRTSAASTPRRRTRAAPASWRCGARRRPGGAARRASSTATRCGW
jgi:hypothetical protein